MSFLTGLLPLLSGWIATVIAILVGIFGLGGATGCTATLYGKTVDTTQLAKAAFEGEKNVTYTALPGKMVDPTGRTAGDVWIPSVPGKNVHVTTWGADGAKTLEYTGSRSEVLDMVFAGVEAVDAAKYVEAEANRRYTLELIDRAMALIPVIQGMMAPKPSGGSTGGGTPARSDSEIAMLLTNFLPQIRDPNLRVLAEQVLRDRFNIGVAPAPQPAPNPFITPGPTRP